MKNTMSDPMNLYLYVLKELENSFFIKETKKLWKITIDPTNLYFYVLKKIINFLKETQKN